MDTNHDLLAQKHTTYISLRGTAVSQLSDRCTTAQALKGTLLVIGRCRRHQTKWHYITRWDENGLGESVRLQREWAGEVKLLDQELNTVWFCLPVRLQEKEDYYISSLATFLFILSPNNVSGGSWRFPVHYVDQESASQAYKVWNSNFCH